MRIINQGKRPIEFIQLYGERNSGTTYLARLLQDNMKTPDNLLGMLPSDQTPLGNKTFGYKHWFIDGEKLKAPQADQTLFVVIYRNPYTWIRAMMDRPYALARSISGRPVEELRTIKLEGHINGRDTKNELDPETNQTQTIFQLRARKIASFEGLRTRAENVAYINLEELLESPPAVIERLARTFATAFKTPLSCERAPYKQLIREYQSPPQFNAHDTEILNTALDWDAENSIGYDQGNYALKPKALSHFIILHGGSSVGKTYLMKEIARKNARIKDIEMDECQYWKDGQPMLRHASLRALLPDTTKADFAEFTGLIDKRSKKGNRCLEHLLVNLKSTLPSQTENNPNPLVVIATCGSLPNPAPKDQHSPYQWLSQRLPIKFHHLLVEISPELHLERMKKRGREGLKDEILRFHDKKVSRRDHYDAVISDFDGAKTFIEGATGLSLTPPAQSPDKPRVRMHRAGLTHIQIYGERNSGTKYLTQLITDNVLDQNCVLGSYANKKDPINKARLIGYKHYYPRPEKLAKHQAETLFLVIYKNPYTWIRSMLAKPYHFKDCLKGKTILDLPDLELAGYDIHGREIPDVHPDTGKRITMFDLRKFKIQEWEKLSHSVSNVAFVNYENLLVSPTPIIQAIADEFGSLFRDGDVVEHIPDEKYLAKYVTPAPFSDEEIAVMNANIDWSAEARIGYRKNNFFIPD